MQCLFCNHDLIDVTIINVCSPRFYRCDFCGKRYKTSYGDKVSYSGFSLITKELNVIPLNDYEQALFDLDKEFPNISSQLLEERILHD